MFCFQLDFRCLLNQIAGCIKTAAIKLLSNLFQWICFSHQNGIHCPQPFHDYYCYAYIVIAAAYDCKQLIQLKYQLPILPLSR